MKLIKRLVSRWKLINVKRDKRLMSFLNKEGIVPLSVIRKDIYKKGYSCIKYDCEQLVTVSYFLETNKGKLYLINKYITTGIDNIQHIGLYIR